jgi:hypothetical protein
MDVLRRVRTFVEEIEGFYKNSRREDVTCYDRCVLFPDDPTDGSAGLSLFFHVRIAGGSPGWRSSRNRAIESEAIGNCVRVTKRRK